jgi:hypothetical protein
MVEKTMIGVYHILMNLRRHFLKALPKEKWKVERLIRMEMSQ